MRKWFGLLFIILLIACKRDAEPLTPTAVSAVSTPNGTGVVTVAVETAGPPTNTPNPTTAPTETATPHPSITLTPTPTEEFVPPTWPPLPPVTVEAGNSADLYRLRAWSDVEAAELVARMTDYADGIRADWELYYRHGDRGRKEIIEVGREFILRYPNSPHRTEVEWHMVDASTYYPSKSSNEMLAKLIEVDLNAGIVTLETLDMYLHPHWLKVSLQNCQSCASFPTAIPNLLGDGQEIPLFLIDGYMGNIGGGILMAIWQDVNDSFVVTPILSQWASVASFSGGITNFEARDITGNDRPELLVEAWGQSGTIRNVTIHMYQWDGGMFVELAGTPFTLSDLIFVDQWEFVDGDDSSRLQIVSGYDHTTIIYEWTGNSYEAVEVIEENVPPDPTDTYFASEWIGEQISQSNYTEVVAYLEEALQISVGSSNLIELQDHRAWQFVLGMNYVYLEDGERARAVFEALRYETSPAELIGYSQAAGAFLAHYDGLDSAYEACRAAYDVLVETELAPSTITSLCDFDKLFVEKLAQYDGAGSVLDYVGSAELIHSQQLDLNGDGQLEWILALSHPTLYPPAYVKVWAVLVSEMGAEVIKLPAYLGTTKEIEEISVDIHSFLPFDTPLIAILSNKNFNLVQLVLGNKWETKSHMNAIPAADYNLQMVEDVLQLELFFDVATLRTGIDRIVYQWDGEMEKFIEVSRHAPNSLGVPFHELLDSAEMLIFEDGDFAAAIPILTAIADEFEPTDDFTWAFSLPKALYLLGLAHEMEGNETQAVAAYWRLWHDYPTDPYALMGAAKLEEK